MKAYLWFAGALLFQMNFVNAEIQNEEVGKLSSQFIQKKIHQIGAHWKAQENWVSKLSETEKMRLMGLGYLPKHQLEFESIHSIAENTAIDWRNKDGANWLSPAMNQGNCGSCVAFATVATLEAQVSIANGAPWLRPSFSPQALFGCGGGSCDSGWMPGSAARYLKNSGIPDEACLPYTSGSTGEDVACNQKCTDATERSLKIRTYSTPSGGIFGGGSVDSVKAALKKGPLVTTLTVYDDFIQYSKGIYKHVTGKVAGGHAVSLVGYDDSKRAWLIRNSWGNEWGEEGFAWISWDDTSGVGGETWLFDVAQKNASLSVQKPQDRAIVSKSTSIELQSTGGMNLISVKFNILGPDHRTIISIPCQKKEGVNCSADFNTAGLPDGRYEINADNGPGGVRSQNREFYVLNSEPNLALTLQPTSGLDLGKPVSGRPEFNIEASSGSVPMNFVEFRVTNAEGKVVSHKMNSFIVNKMKIGWRSTGVPNGKYQISLYGEQIYLGKSYGITTSPISITVKN